MICLELVLKQDISKIFEFEKGSRITIKNEETLANKLLTSHAPQPVRNTELSNHNAPAYR